MAMRVTAANAAKVSVEIVAEPSKFAHGVRAAVSHINTLAERAGGVMSGLRNRVNAGVARWGGMIAAGAGAMVANEMRKAVDYAGRIHDLSRKFGISTDALQAFDTAAEQTGTSIESVAQAFKFMQISQAQALSGSEAEQAAFARMGISIEDLKTKNAQTLFTQIGRAIASGTGGAQEMADIVQLLGRSGDEILPAFRDGFIEAAEAAKQSGTIIEEAVINRLDDVGDRWAVTMKQMRAGFAALADVILKVFTFIRAGVSGAASFAGTLAGGGSLKDAWKSMKDATNAVYAEQDRISRQTATPGRAGGELIEKAKKTKTSSAEDALRDAQKSSKTSSLVPAADALARVGLFRGAIDPAQSTRQQLLRELKLVTRAVQDLNRKIEEE